MIVYAIGLPREVYALAMVAPSGLRLFRGPLPASLDAAALRVPGISPVPTTGPALILGNALRDRPGAHRGNGDVPRPFHLAMTITVIGPRAVARYTRAARPS